MPCYRPLSAWRKNFINPSGKRGITFSASEAYLDMPLTLPCGQCIGCRLERSRQWAIRSVHEASLYEDNCFVTLTYDDKSLPQGFSLDPDAVPLFMKRLRKRFGEGIRVFYCGEYGEKFSRPHYHLIIFNFDFPDKEPWSSRDGTILYRSSILEQLWSDPETGVPYGFATVGSVTFESAAYVARYVTKKITGKGSVEHYNIFDRETGEIYFERLPEFARPSRRPGLGRPWFDRFYKDVYPDDFVVVRGMKMRPPKYYDSLFASQFPSEYSKLVAHRKKYALEHVEDSTWERLLVREEIQHRKFDLLHRGYEANET